MRVRWTILTLAVLAGTSSGCDPAIDATDAGSGLRISGLTIVLDPSTVSVAPGGSAQSIGTIRGARSEVSSTVAGTPNDVSVRVTSATTTDSVTTKKYIFFADAAAVPGTYLLRVRALATGQQDVETQLTLKVLAP